MNFLKKYLFFNLLSIYIYITESFNISGINYNIRIGPDWELNKCKSYDRVEKELITIKNITNNIKIFSLTDCNQSQIILDIAKKNKFKNLVRNMDI